MQRSGEGPAWRHTPSVYEGASAGGVLWLSWPVSSKTITAHEMVRVTPAAIAAAPTTAYAPAVTCTVDEEAESIALSASPKARPEAAPMRNTGVKTPHEMGQPTATTVKANLHTV